MRELTARIERWETAKPFVIARGTKNHVDVVTAEIRHGNFVAQGEGTPIYYKGDSTELAVEALQHVAADVASGLGRQELLEILPPCAARNALDAALWDLEAKLTGKRVWELLSISVPEAMLTAYTISLGTPEAMFEAAKIAADRPLLKLKLGGEGDVERVRAVRRAVPNARLIADANEGWVGQDIEYLCHQLHALGVELVEQPLPAGADEDLRHVRSPLPLAADESLQSRAELDAVMGKYAFVNIKLDKCGGLTEAMLLAKEAKARGLGILTGCMLSTSLGIAPAYVAAAQGSYADLDGPLLLARDRPHALSFHNSDVYQPKVALWG